MEARVRLFGAAALLGGLLHTAFGQTALRPDAIPVVSVCEALNDLGRYNGKAIVVIGRFGSTDEGSWLSDDCERRLVTDGYTWASIISTTYSRSEMGPPPDLPKGFKWDDEALKSKLKQMQTKTALRALRQSDYGFKWVAIFGRFETRFPLQVAVGSGGRLMGHGFGHLNAAPAQLISNDRGFRQLEAK